MAHIYEVGEVEGQIFVAMEYVHGLSLREWLAALPGDIDAIVEVFVAAGYGLAAAHDVGLVHRDFKPGNVIVGLDDGRVRVLDFGLARSGEHRDIAADETGRTLEGADDSFDEVLTVTGALIGTPAYMAPEQFIGGVIGPHTDQFSFCVALFEALHGVRPFTGATLDELSALVRTGSRSSLPRQSAVPTWLAEVVERGLEANATKRWPSMQELLDALQDNPLRRRRRRRAAVGAAALVVASASALLGQRQIERGRCEAEADSVRDDWNEDSRALGLASFTDTGLGFAATAWTRVAARVDRWTAAWRAERYAACVDRDAAESHRRQRLACLDRQRYELEGLLDVLTTANATTVERSITASAALPEPARCDDPLWLARTLGRQDRGGQEPVLRLFAKSRALLDAARYAEALETVAASLDGGLPDEGLRAMALLLRTRALDGLGRYDEGEQSGRESYFLAMRHGEDRVAVRAATELAALVGFSRSRHADGLEWTEHGDVLIDRLDQRESLANATLQIVRAQILHAQGKYQEAIAIERRALDLQHALLGADHPLLSSTYNNLGAAFKRLGDYDEARAQFETALALSDRAYGQDHPNSATTLFNIGDTALKQGDTETALALGRRVLAINENAYGPLHPTVMNAHNELANAHEFRGELDRALFHSRRSVEIAEATMDPSNSRFGVMLGSLALMLARAGEFDEALARSRRSVTLTEAVFGPDHPRVASMLNTLGFILGERGEYEEGAAVLRRTIDIVRRSLGEQHEFHAIAQQDLALLLQRSGDTKGALELYEASLATLGGDGRPTTPYVTLSRIGVGETLLRLGRLEDARVALEQAAAEHRGMDTHAADRARGQFALARALQASELDTARALELARSALDLYTEAGAAGRRGQAEVLDWLNERPDETRPR